MRLFRFNSKLLHSGSISSVLCFRRVSLDESSNPLMRKLDNYLFILCRLSLEMVGQDSCVSVVEDMEEKLTLEILSISSLQTIVNIVLSSYK